MENEAPPAPVPAPVAPSPARRRFFQILILAGGVALAALLAGKAPKEQHVRFVLGARAAEVTALDVQYVAEGGEAGETVRAAHLAFEPGKAPRVVAHDPALPDGPYKLRIEVDSREGRRSAERQVTLGGGTTSVDLSHVLESPP